METIEKIALVFTIVGALNWGLIGLFDFNLVTMLFQEGSFLTKLIYITMIHIMIYSYILLINVVLIIPDYMGIYYLFF